MSCSIALLVAFCLFTVDDHCGDFPEKRFDESENTKWTNRYVNFVYRYSVKIPKGLSGYSDLPPSPQHGVGIVLSWEPRAYIYFDGSYNSSGARNTRELEQEHLKWLAEESSQITGILHHKSRLGLVSARRYVARHTCRKLQGTFIEDETIMLHKGIVYTASLLTSPDRYSRDKAVLDQMMRSWRLAHRE
ncbi:MAG TPA: hypothetical protein VNO24_13680 [Blastocatellia bacterium]|nr:hypothetical protein [Blastocatellia bacterium]